MDRDFAQLDQWLKARVDLPRLNGDYLVDASGLSTLASGVANELSLSANDDAVSALAAIIQLMLLDEHDSTRHLVGSVAVRVDRHLLAGAIISGLGIASWVIAGSNFISGTLTVASAFQTALSAISILTAEERSIISLTFALANGKSGESTTLVELFEVTANIGLTPIACTNLLAQLRNKGAIAWNGLDSGEIRVKKWF